MPKASPLPRKYKSSLDDAQSRLRVMAKNAKLVLEALEKGQRSPQHLQKLIHEIETEALRLALDLAEIEVAAGCDGCPAAPPITRAQAHLLVLAGVLEQQAELARQAVRETTGSDCIPLD